MRIAYFQKKKIKSSLQQKKLKKKSICSNRAKSFESKASFSLPEIKIGVLKIEPL